MRHLALAISFLVLVSAVSSCGGERARGLLAFADSLLEDCPDSARAVLVRDSSLICRAGRAGRMWYALSRTEADDKCYVTHTSDSAILAAASYYSGRGEPLPEARAWYLLGRVYCDMRFYGSALSAFDNALKVAAGGDTAVCRYQSRACTWAAFVYEEKKLYGKALYYDKKAYRYAKKSGMPSSEVYSLRDIGRDYNGLKENAMAIKYYCRAASLAKNIKDSYLYNMVQEELAAVYLEEGMTDEAYKALSAPFRSTLESDLSTHYFIWATYYDSLGIYDSAVYYTDMGIKYGSRRSVCEAVLDLARIYGEKGDYKKSYECYERYLCCSDSLAKDNAVEYEDFIDNIERKIIVERRNTELAETCNRLRLLIAAVFFSVVVCAFAAVRFYNKRKRMFMLRRERVERNWGRRHEHDQTVILSNIERIKQLEHEIALSDVRLSEVRKQLIGAEMDMLSKQNENLLSEQRHKELLVKDFERSEIYRLYHCQAFIPDNNHFQSLQDALDDTYDRFTFRLKELYPPMRFEELYVCCLVKAGVDAKRIRVILGRDNASYVSMVKVRLYKKFFGQKVSVAEFDNFIRKF